MEKKPVATTKKSFILYTDFSETLDHLTDEEAGIVFKAIFHYQAHGELPDMDRTLKLLMQSLVSQFKRNDSKYTDICKSRSEAGRLGGQATQANARFAKQNKQVQANQADSDSDSDNESDTDRKDISSLPAEAVSIADLIIDHVRSLNPNAKNITSKLKHTRFAWASEIERLHRLDGAEWIEIEAVFKWASNDSFWRVNILGAVKLRKQFDDLKIRMSNPRTPQPPSRHQITNSQNPEDYKL